MNRKEKRQRGNDEKNWIRDEGRDEKGDGNKNKIEVQDDQSDGLTQGLSGMSGPPPHRASVGGFSS